MRRENSIVKGSLEFRPGPLGSNVVLSWGLETRDFYAEDPWKNPLCFVEEGTVYAG